MTTSNSAVVGSAAPSAWAWPLNVDRFRRRDRLSGAESDALQALGFDLLRLDRDRERPQWQVIRRLTAPLDEALAVLRWHPDTVFQRRFARYGTAIVLHRCGELGRDLWAWSTREWADLLRPAHLRQCFPGQIGMQARPYLLAHAYLLAGFTAFDLVGPFARCTLAQRVFGVDTVDEAIEPVRAVLSRWGYRAPNLESMVCTLLLLNRSPLLSDLASPALDSLRSDPAIERHFHGRHLARCSPGAGCARSHRCAACTEIRRRTGPDHRHRPRLGTLGRTLARRLTTATGHPRHPPGRAGQARPMARRRTP